MSREIKSYSEQNETLKFVECSKSSASMEIYSIECTYMIYSMNTHIKKDLKSITKFPL